MSTPGPIKVHAVTWNMGSQAPSEDAVDEIYSQLIPNENEPLPDVISVSTQEEYASDENCLAQKLLEKLNAGKTASPPYKIAYVESHHTGAGFKPKQPGTWRSVRDEHTVRVAVIVKSEYELTARAHIDFQDDIGKSDNKKKNKGNKSIITVKGELTKNGKKVMDMAISGCHLDPNKDTKRRQHTDMFLKSSGVKASSQRTYDEICEEASTFRMISGDFNERTQVYGSAIGEQQNEAGVTRDNMDHSSLALHGFDLNRPPTIRKNDPSNERLPGTYGFRATGLLNPKMKGIINPEMKRKNVAVGGFLDRIAISTGLKVRPQAYGYDADSTQLDESKRKIIRYYGSDHLPVIGRYDVERPKDDPNSKFVLAKEFVRERLPKINPEQSDGLLRFHKLINRNTSMVNPDDIDSMLERDLMYSFNTMAIRHLDSEYTSEEYIRIFAHVGPQATLEELKQGLESRYKINVEIQENYEELLNKINGIKNVQANQDALVKIHEFSNQYQDLKNMFEMIKRLPPEEITKEDKAELMRHCQAWLDGAYLNALKAFNGEEFNLYIDHDLDTLLAEHRNIKIIEEFQAKKRECDVFIIANEDELALSPPLPNPPQQQPLANAQSGRTQPTPVPSAQAAQAAQPPVSQPLRTNADKRKAMLFQKPLEEAAAKKKHHQDEALRIAPAPNNSSAGSTANPSTIEIASHRLPKSKPQ